MAHLRGSQPPLPEDEHRLQFVLRLAMRMRLVQPAERRLVLAAENSRKWLRAAPTMQLAAMFRTWAEDKTWNDLWHVPRLYPQPTGWSNDPFTTRRHILALLRSLEQDVWYGIDDFVGWVKGVQPDFQRPDGDYDSWYLLDEHGQALMGFEHWEAVEGALLMHLLSCTLYELGVVSLGGEEPSEAGAPPLCFRITPLGWALLHPPHPLPPMPPPEPLKVRSDLRVEVSYRTSLYDRFRLTRFAELESRSPTGAVYRISPASIGAAVRAGIDIKQIAAFLERAGREQLPDAVSVALHSWQHGKGAVTLERTVLLRLKDPRVLKSLQAHSDIAPLLGEVLGPDAVSVPNANVERLRRLLAANGYLVEDSAAPQR